MGLRKWDIAWAGLDPTLGHEQAGHRPVLVFSNDSIAPVIGLAAIVPLTTHKRNRRVYPTEVLLPETATGLRASSLALCHQLRTISSRRLSSAKGRLDDKALRSAVEKAVSVWLDLRSDIVAT